MSSPKVVNEHALYCKMQNTVFGIPPWPDMKLKLKGIAGALDASNDEPSKDEV